MCADPGCVGKAFSAGRLGHAFKRPCEPPASGVAAILSGRVVNDKRVGQFAADAAVGGKLMLGVGPQTSLLLVRLRATPLR